MPDSVEQILRAQANGSEAVFQQLMKAYLGRVEQFLDGLDPRRRAAWIARVYSAPASLN